MKRLIAIAGLVFALIGLPATSEARNIVVTNDDGLTSNVLALYRTLKQSGHDVIVSVPCTNQSGMGAALIIGRPLVSLHKDCRNGAAKAGSPGAGSMTRTGIDAKDFYYVDGTPVMAMAYGVDVIGQRRWGKQPDLVLSGPNEGQNLGAIILSSGTVSAAQAAAIRGIPAIALSAGGNTIDDKELANSDSAKVAALAAELVARLDGLAGNAPLLPDGLALNVNFPDNLDGAGWRASRIGTYNSYTLRFVENMARDSSPTMIAMAKQHGASLPQLPGLAIDINNEAPSEIEQDDEAVVYKTAIAVSPMQAGYEATTLDGWIAWMVAALEAK